jgi:hypothetical protein
MGNAISAVFCLDGAGKLNAKPRQKISVVQLEKKNENINCIGNLGTASVRSNASIRRSR